MLLNFIIKLSLSILLILMSFNGYHKLGQTIVFQKIGQKIYGDPVFDLICESNSSLPITFTSNNTNVISIVNNKATIVGAGSATITAYSPGNNIYEPTITSQIVTVYKKDLFIIVKNKVRIYGQNNPIFDYSIIGFVNSDKIDNINILPSAYANVDNFTTTGNYPIKLTNGFDDNYNIVGVEGILSVLKAPLTVKVMDTTINYGDIPNFKLKITGLVNNDIIDSIDVLPTIVPNFSNDIGEYIISIHSGFDNNYEFTTHISGLLKIVQPITLGLNYQELTYPIKDIEIYNILGILVYRSEINTIPNLPSGQYIIKFNFKDNGIIFRKIVID
jgi:hypothetical protein